MSERSDLPRRVFLKRTVALVPASALAAAGASATSQGHATQPGVSAAPPVEPYSPRFFTAPEWAFINAACSRLVPEDDSGPGAVTLQVPEFIDRQMEDAYGHAARWYMQGPFVEDAPPELGYQSRQTPRELYRRGMAATDAACRRRHGQPFAQLAAPDQDAMLTGMADGKIGQPEDRLDRFFAFLWQNVKEGYLADPIHGGNHHMGSWQMLGFPGARASYTEWSQRHNESYPLGPVSISGQRG